MGRLKDTLLDNNFVRFERPEPTEADLAEAEAEYFASLHPMPIPCDPTEEMPILQGRELFTKEVIARVLEANKAWLQETPRTSLEVFVHIFHRCHTGDMSIEEVRSEIEIALFLAGYLPTGHGYLTAWSFPV